MFDKNKVGILLTLFWLSLFTVPGNLGPAMVGWTKSRVPLVLIVISFFGGFKKASDPTRPSILFENPPINFIIIIDDEYEA